MFRKLKFNIFKRDHYGSGGISRTSVIYIYWRTDRRDWNWLRRWSRRYIFITHFRRTNQPSYIPVDVILIIMSVITAIAAMQVAGGMDWLVQLAENFLRKHPERITFYAPMVTFLMTLMAGTGHTAFSTLPVIAEVAKGQGIRPSRPLSIAVIASQIAITASPISAAVVAFSVMLAPQGVSYLTLLLVCIPSTFVACMIGAFVANFMGVELKDDKIYQERLAQGLVKISSATQRKIAPTAKRATFIFLGRYFLLFVMQRQSLNQWALSRTQL